MLCVTNAACDRLSQMLAEAGIPDEVAIRFVPEPDGLAMRADEPRPGDTTFEHHGRIILVLDEQLAQELSNKTLDIEPTEEAGLALNPGGPR